MGTMWGERIKRQKVPPSVAEGDVLNTQAWWNTQVGSFPRSPGKVGASPFHLKHWENSQGNAGLFTNSCFYYVSMPILMSNK